MKVLDTEHNFLGIEQYSYNEAKCVIQQLPFEYSSSYGQGSDKGPQAIIEASQYVEFYDIETNREIYSVCNLVSLEALGADTSDPEALMNAIYKESLNHFNAGKFLVSLGSEHSVTYGVFKAAQEHHGNIGILQIDAHSDLRMEYGGTKWSHACVMARIHELDAPPIVQVGIRAQCIEESQLMKSSTNIHCWYDKDIHTDDSWMQDAIDALPNIIYITLDADGFDALVSPEVGTIEPGGLGWYQSLRFLRMVFEQKEVIGFDIVELNPASDNGRTAYNMAQMCYKLINYKYM